jgi:hypothetical protein
MRASPQARNTVGLAAYSVPGTVEDDPQVALLWVLGFGIWDF